ncbi:DODA-type extradiol aromatic ring-opening family dioxygenase [Limnobacter parvus]|uniref:Dioxygenase n=1 Tax=Limnobacter parvus TaxID=2939690 RepID=A0ABT1XEQ0_9BURK|nr:class III extradiol ring-cleavage dioxygenase [Limnobacter parvus]MCR2745381.1 dioxygenase [Limnobacter parvus]
MTQLIDSIFISHGAPTYAVDPGLPGKALEHIGLQLIAQNTQALIVLSPHWRSNKLAVTSNTAPVIVHDFHGFPKALYELQPEISGAPELASKLTNEFAAEFTVELRPQQGFDHGAWVPYIHLFPQGGPPMLQLSMPVDFTPQTAMLVGAAVGEFARKHNAVVVGSGSLTHNFDDMDLRQGTAGEATPAYVGEFTNWVQIQLKAGDRDAIANATQAAPHFERAHPDDDHYLPLPFAMGAARLGSQVEVLPEDVRYKALSMQSFVFRCNSQEN